MGSQHCIDECGYDHALFARAGSGMYIKDGLFPEDAFMYITSSGCILDSRDVLNML